MSHATLLTGLYPPRHGVRDNGTFALAEAFDTVPELLRGSGYDTAAVVSAVVLQRRHRLDQGFRIYDDDLGSGYAAGTEVGERPAEATTSAALGALSLLRAPFFLWVHYFDPHEEYRPPTRFGRRRQRTDAALRRRDRLHGQAIGKLLAALPAETIVAVVGDHGEMLGEHGETIARPAARRRRAARAAPRSPGRESRPAGSRTASCAPPTWRRLCSPLAGVALPARLDGAALLPLPSVGGSCQRISYSESFLPFFAYKWYPLRSLSDGQLLFLQAPRPSLYRLASDPGEERDLGELQPAARSRWQERLARAARRGRRDARADAAGREPARRRNAGAARRASATWPAAPAAR